MDEQGVAGVRKKGHSNAALMVPLVEAVYWPKEDFSHQSHMPFNSTMGLFFLFFSKFLLTYTDLQCLCWFRASTAK